MERRGRIAVIGGGKIGELVIAHLSRHYPVSVFDLDLKKARDHGEGAAEIRQLDVNDQPAIDAALSDKQLVVNCCPLFCNLPISRAARRAGISYIDLSEDVETGAEIERLAEGTHGNFVPRCGVAPGFIQIVAAHLMKGYDTVERCHLRVGALPENPTNSLKYNLTWSTDGLINEYGNSGEAIVNGELKLVEPLEGYERIGIDGVEYEAFNTSGGLGTLARSMVGKVKNLNYKTIRYLGHRDLMKFLLFDLKLNEYRAILKQILESSVPATEQDLVIVLVSIVGQKEGVLTQQTYTKTIAHGELYDRHWTAIQLITASSAASIAELIMTERLPHAGYVRQEEIDFEAICSTPYGAFFRDPRWQQDRRVAKKDRRVNS